MSKTITQFCLQKSQIRNVILQLEILQIYASAWKQGQEHQPMKKVGQK